MHISGFDSHQGLQSLDQPWSGAFSTDCWFVPTRLRPVLAVTRASHRWRNRGRSPVDLTSNGRPRLVALNIYYSASRSRRRVRRSRCRGRYRFPGRVRRHTGRTLLATFYQAWKLASWNTVAAFRHAWQTVRNQNQALHGTGIVLWSARSIRETLPGYWTAGARFETKEMNRLWTQAQEKDRITLTPENICEHVELDVQTLPALNYSILHNDALFASLHDSKTGMGVGRVANIHVHVELHVGTDSYPFRLTLDLGNARCRRTSGRGFAFHWRRPSRVPCVKVCGRHLVAVTWGEIPIRPRDVSHHAATDR